MNEQDELEKKRQEKAEEERKAITILMAKDPEVLSKTELLQVISYRMHISKDEILRFISSYVSQTQGTSAKLKEMMELTKSLIGFQEEIEYKVDALFDLVKEKVGITDDEFEAKWDEKKGMILRKDSDKIEVGDIAWINYTSEIVGETGKEYEGKEANKMPVRIGSGAFYAEDAMLGLSCGKGSSINFTQEFEETYHNKTVAGKSVIFSIEIDKVKVPSIVLDKRTETGAIQ